MEYWFQDIVIPPLNSIYFSGMVISAHVHVRSPHHSHNHPNSIISGVFYIDVEDDRIEFERPQSNQFVLPPKDYNMYNSGSWWLGVEEKSLLLFPSTLVHSVPQIHHSKTRISLAFNTFIRGYIGDDKHLDGLHL